MGRATVARFLADGAKVVVADLNEANGAETLACQGERPWQRCIARALRRGE